MWETALTSHIVCIHTQLLTSGREPPGGKAPQQAVAVLGPAVLALDQVTVAPAAVSVAAVSSAVLCGSGLVALS
jgi:hypothetical protein